jgi:hypothetical protein
MSKQSIQLQIYDEPINTIMSVKRSEYGMDRLLDFQKDQGFS